MKKTFASATLTCIALVGFAACDAPSETTQLEVDFTCAPDPAVAVRSSGVTYTVTNPDSTVTTYEYDWYTNLVLQIRETGGLAVSIRNVALKVEQATGGIVITPSGGEIERYKHTVSAADNYIPGNGSADIGFNVWYDLPNGGPEALVTVSLVFEDDKENPYSKSHECRVAP